jgi:hypothetical protein
LEEGEKRKKKKRKGKPTLLVGRHMKKMNYYYYDRCCRWRFVRIKITMQWQFLRTPR